MGAIAQVPGGGDLMFQRDLALIVTRDQTSRDRADLLQPFDVEAAGGVTPRNKAQALRDLLNYWKTQPQ